MKEKKQQPNDKDTTHTSMFTAINPEKMTREQLIELVRKQQNIINVEQNILNITRQELYETTQELYNQKQIISNPFMSDSEKCNVSAYMFYANSTKRKEDGSFYYNRNAIATLLGYPAKIQTISAIHSRMVNNGYIEVTTEKQKNNPNAKNYFDKPTEKLLAHLDSICLKDHKPSGGRRITIHHECGGICIDRQLYLCTKCGKDYIEEEKVYHLTEDEWENREDSNNKLPTMEALDDYEPTITFAEMPKGPEVSQEEVEAFHRAMQAAKDRNVKQDYSLYFDRLLYKQEIIYGYEQGRSPPNSS